MFSTTGGIVRTTLLASFAICASCTIEPDPPFGIDEFAPGPTVVLSDASPVHSFRIRVRAETSTCRLRSEQFLGVMVQTSARSGVGSGVQVSLAFDDPASEVTVTKTDGAGSFSLGADGFFDNCQEFLPFTREMFVRFSRRDTGLYRLDWYVGASVVSHVQVDNPDAGGIEIEIERLPLP